MSTAVTLSVEEAAARVGLPVWRVRRALASGALAAVDLGRGRSWRVRVSDVEVWSARVFSEKANSGSVNSGVRVRVGGG